MRDTHSYSAVAPLEVHAICGRRSAPPGPEDVVCANAEAALDTFLTRSISYRCGQMSREEFVDDFLPCWFSDAFASLRALARLGGSAAAAVGVQGGAVRVSRPTQLARRLQAAVAEAEEELCSEQKKRQQRRQGKRITFSVTPARPPATATPPRAPPVEEGGAADGLSDEEDDAYGGRSSGVVYGTRDPRSAEWVPLPTQPPSLPDSKRTAALSDMQRWVLAGVLIVAALLILFRRDATGK